METLMLRYSEAYGYEQLATELVSFIRDAQGRLELLSKEQPDSPI